MTCHPSSSENTISGQMSELGLAGPHALVLLFHGPYAQALDPWLIDYPFLCYFLFSFKCLLKKNLTCY